MSISASELVPFFSWAIIASGGALVMHNLEMVYASIQKICLKIFSSLDNADDESFQPGFSKEKEIEKLRTSGSRTQSVAEIARVKNINTISMGKHEVDTWYFAP